MRKPGRRLRARPAITRALDIVISEDDIAARVEAMADDIAPMMTDDWVMVALMDGAAAFAIDMARALARRGVHPVFDALWLSSYGDDEMSSGKMRVLSDLARPVDGKSVLILDDVYETGRTLAFARRRITEAGAAEVKIAIFANKPADWRAEDSSPDFLGLDAPDKFLVGYGMDHAGRYRGLPYIAALI